MLKNKISYETVMRFLKKNYPVIILMTIGILARGLFLNSFPGGINQDEAFGAYEAYSLLHYGMDSWGYHFPIYLNTWGSGMSALNSYLMMPFMAIFGAHLWVVRIPQFISSCITLYIIYKLFHKLINKDAALWALLYAAICPYLITISRWSIDCNLAPHFLLWAFYFFVIGIDNNKYYMISAMLYGLSLYTYATIWPLVPIMLLIQFIYILYTKRFRFNIYVIISVIILIVLAMPLLLFLLVNYDYLPEIRTPFFSIPHLTVMRKSDISFDEQKLKLWNLLCMLSKQTDGFYYNASPEFGLYYQNFLIFAIIGFIYNIKKLIKSIFSRQYDGLVLLLIPLICAFGLGTLIEVNINRINCIHIPLITFIITGLYITVDFLKKRFKYCVPVIASALLILFITFEIFYFKVYSPTVSHLWDEGIDEALEYAINLAGDNGIVYVDTISYPIILFYSQYPVQDYINTVAYTNYPHIFLSAGYFGPFIFDNPDVAPGDICVIKDTCISNYEDAGFTIVQFDHCAVAY